MEVNMDEKWKLSKKGSRKASSGEGNNGAFFKRSASTREARVPNTTPRSFSSRCSGLVKEQRARFYIMRRCVTMLICWRDYP